MDPRSPTSRPDFCGIAASSEAEAGRAFLQERLAFFSKMVLLLGAGFYVFANLLHHIAVQDGLGHWLECPHNWYHLGASVVFAAMWGLAARGSRTLAQLRAIDAVGVFLACAAYALMSWSGCITRSEYPAILCLTLTLITRAILVPSEPRLTTWLGVVSSLPTIAATYAIYAESPPRIDASPLIGAAFSGLWCAVAVTVATVTSRVVYGLRRQVSEARRLGQYTLEEKLGSGGMGEVYKARHAMLRRPTAIKLLRCDLAGEKNIARFEREVQLTSRLTHPNTIAIFDYGRTPEGIFYYAMEYLPGVTLDALVRDDGPQSSGRVIHILKQVCASLGEAHSIGLIHRDIKGANVILCERGGMLDVVKVLDFGLAKDIGSFESIALSGANVITGTPLYLSPESIRTPERVDARSDIYSVGVLGYWLLTGKHVFEGENFVEVCGHHLHTPPVPPSIRASRPVPRDLEELILGCLEKDPDRRPPDARALWSLLEGCESAGDWTEDRMRAWWRDNEVSIFTARSREEVTPTVPYGATLTVTSVGEPSQTE